jgi:hypothetical protein
MASSIFSWFTKGWCLSAKLMQSLILALSVKKAGWSCAFRPGEARIINTAKTGYRNNQKTFLPPITIIISSIVFGIYYFTLLFFKLVCLILSGSDPLVNSKTQSQNNKRVNKTLQ